MIRELRVRGLGVLDDVTVELAPGLNVVSGETGAGKTLLVTSLAMLSAARPPARRAHDAETVIEAAASCPDWLAARLEEAGIDVADAEVVLARRIGADGRSRARVNGSLAPVGTLVEVGDALVEIHGQGEGFALARPERQLRALDEVAGAAPLRDAYTAALARLRGLQRERDELEAAGRERAREADVLSFQVNEIDRAALDPQTDEELEGELSRLEHAERLQELGELAADRLSGEQGGGALAEAAAALQEAARIDPGAAAVAQRLASISVEAMDVAADVRSWTESCAADPQRLAELRDRAAMITALRRKYGETITEILAFADEARIRLGTMRELDDRAGEMSDEIEGAEGELDSAAVALTAARKTAAAQLTSAVTAELPALALGGARFEVVCEPGPPTESGRDDVRFLFSSAAKLPAAPIGSIASGGELSRVMIAVTLALASTHQTPTLVFDEADAGVGGSAALDLAARLKRLGATHQVLVVTHLPQIAAFADHHVVVSREGASVSVRAVFGDERVGEISRMLAGLHDSDRARAHAQELIDLGSQPPARDGAPDGRSRRRTGRVAARSAH